MVEVLRIKPMFLDAACNAAKVPSNRAITLLKLHAPRCLGAIGLWSISTPYPTPLPAEHDERLAHRFERDRDHSIQRSVHLENQKYRARRGQRAQKQPGNDRRVSGREPANPSHP
jgi:hypothetical protein